MREVNESPSAVVAISMSDTHRVTLNESRSFAALSGDFNVQHLDPVRARRLLFGSSVIHGIHSVLLALDSVMADFAAGGRTLRSIKVIFSAPAPTGSNLGFIHDVGPGGATVIQAKLDSRTVVTVDIVWSPENAVAARPEIPDELFAAAQPVTRTINDVDGYKAQVALKAERATLRRLFPNVAAKLPIDQVAVLLATTRIVGMECPGSNSILAAFDIEFKSPQDSTPLLNYAVTRIRPALNICALTISGAGVQGEINAMFRPPVIEQPGMLKVQARVPRGSFAGQRALIVGGSRGLGELTAKIIAAGDGEAAITYARGRDDAERVVEDICYCGGTAWFFELDVTKDDIAALAQIESPITHLYYFASPRIVPSRTEAFEQDSFMSYRRYYVDGLESLLLRLLAERKSPLTLFNPSTIYIDRTDARFAEYAAAKAESEKLCVDVQNRAQGMLRVFMPRLPRLRTDQTVGIRDEDMPDALETLFAVLPKTA